MVKTQLQHGNCFIVDILECKRKPDFLVLKCIDNASRDWLISKIKGLAPWKEAKLKWQNVYSIASGFRV